MHELWMALKLGGITGLTMFASSAVNIEDGRVSVTVAVTCAVFIAGIVWWLASRFQKIADANSQINRRLEWIERELKIGNERDRRVDLQED